MNKQQAVSIIKEATEGENIYEVVEMARVLNLSSIIEAYHTLKKHYSDYQIVNRLYGE